MRSPRLSTLLLLCTLLVIPLQATQNTESLAILDLEGRGISTIEAASLTDRLRSELVRTGQIIVVERGQMEQILNEQDFQLTGCTSDECAVEIGQLLGVTHMVAGSIGRVGSTFSIDLRTIDVQTGRIVHSIIRNYRGEIDGLLDQMAPVAVELAVAGAALELLTEQPRAEPPPAVHQPERTSAETPQPAHRKTALAAPGPDDDRATPLVLPRLSGPITLDGFSDEPAWQIITPLPLTMHVPIFEGTMTERTEIRVAYDDDYLYLAGRMYDSDPTGIQAVDIVRDGANWQNDWFGIILDSFNDNENALAFYTNPVGMRTDFSVSNDFQSMRDFNSSWSTFWDAAVQRNDQGWFAELRIPFSSLRFQDDNGAVIMGLTVARVIARKGETHVFPAIPPDWGNISTWKPSQAQRVLFTGVYSRNPLYVTPYALGGLNQAGTAYETANTPARDLGLDVKYGLTSNLTLDLTLNTDFAQVEADDQQINLTRFSLFFPEKRLFFQERASTFEFGLGGGNSRLFHSRRIGIHQKQQVPIYGGARLVSRVGGWDVGAIDMQTAPLMDEDGQTTLPSENLGVARLRRQVINPYSYVGGMVTSRVSNEAANYAYGLDGIFRLFGEDYLTASWAQAFDSEWEEPPGILDAGQLWLNWERRGVKGPVYNVDIFRRGDRFQPGLGFVDRTDVTRLKGQVGYGWFSPESSPILRHLPILSETVYRSSSTGQVESALSEINWYVETKKQASAWFKLDHYFEHLAKTFNLAPEAYVPPGEYRFLQAYVSYSQPSGRLLQASGDVQGGAFYDGWRLTASVAPTWRPNPYFMAGGSIRYDYVTFPPRNQEYVNWIYQLNLKAAFSVTTSVAGLIQYNRAVDAVIVNLRLRYNPREGTDLYLVYNDNLNTDRQREEPALPFSDTRAVLLKYSITFLPGLR